jgi:hypothetical protein
MAVAVEVLSVISAAMGGLGHAVEAVLHSVEHVLIFPALGFW